MKPCKLQDVGKSAFRVDPLATRSGFGVIDDDGRVIQVHVEDVALQQLDPKSTGADHTSVLDDIHHRCKILEVADEKFKRGCVQPGGIILVTYDDVKRAADVACND